ncbi:alpha-L-rhamnosidase [Flavobacterium sp.]|uniref:alpha-L-rhamnosidase n=1 Tax=Flavobacterium sp. TaxID=239 RepID=UPI001B72A71A|nr:alpha-L-rhamnosidase [Flavobacterium sp.]MBP6181849.1 family 78 glycoside hydrolase catalytic domain [Flavobacterium sp.]
MKKHFLLLWIICFSTIAFAQTELRNLTVENAANPIGIGVKTPRFSWQLVSNKRNVTQTAYEIQVKKGNNTVWSSGKVASEASIFNKYSGAPLASDSKYIWQVRVWDNQGKISKWANASFETALLHSNEWKATWIGSGLKSDTVNGVVPMFRKSFLANKKVASAKVYVTSRGLYEVKINGKRMGDSYLSPGWTSYDKHLQYQTYDVSNLLSEGKNAIGVLLGSGWYRTRLGWENKQNIYGKETALLFQMEIKYVDGTTQTIVSDTSWKASNSHIISSEIYNGEVQDARLEQKNYSLAGFDDSKWSPVVAKDFPKNYITAAINEPIRKHENLKPIAVLTSPKGETILDFGQNLAGWVQLSVQGKAGDIIKLSHVEMLDKKGTPYFENLRSAKAQATYSLSGNGIETFEPHFTSFGFRYVKVEGITGKINPENFTAIALYSDVKKTGSFETSNAYINKLQSNIQWSQRGNFLDVPTDCPQRDERLGWTGDAEVFSRTAAYNFNVDQFFAKWLIDVAADQKENGAVPFVIPNALKGSTFDMPVGAAGWSDASIIIPYNMYVSFGDKEVVERQYPSMKAYLNYVRGEAKNDLWNTGFQFADWLSYRVDDSKGMIGMKSAITDNYLVAQCFFAYNTEIMIKAATLLGKAEEVKEYQSLLERIKKAFQAEYMSTSGRLISETQTAYILALQFDMLPENLRAQAVDRLVKNIESYEYHLTTGFLGTPFLNPVLTRFGRNDVAYKLLLQDTYPSWLYPIKAHGATTIWERWDSMKPDGTFQDPSMTSFNHYAYGAVGDWMYRTIAGIDTKEAEGAGYKSIIIKPELGGKLTYAKGSLETNYGLVSSSWKIENNKLLLDIEVPANTNATIEFPTNKLETIKESKTILNSKTKTVGSGKYHFEMEL